MEVEVKPFTNFPKTIQKNHERMKKNLSFKKQTLCDLERAGMIPNMTKNLIAGKNTELLKLI